MLDIEFDKATTARPSLAIEFTPTHVRLMRFEKKTENNFSLRSFSEVEWPAAVVKDGKIIDQEVAAQTILKAIATSRPKDPNTTHVICILPQEYIFFLTLDLPVITKQEMQSLINRKVKDILPMPESEVYWDWHRIKAESNKVVIQLAAISKELIDSYMDTLFKAKLVPLLFEPSAISAARLVNTVDASLGSDNILIELRPQYFVIALTKNSEVVFSSESEIQPVSTKENARMLIRKIEQILRYNATSLEDQSQFPVLIYGHNENIQIDDLAKQLNESGYPLASRINYNIQSKYLSDHLEGKAKDAYIPLIGASIRGMGKDKNGSATINLVPQLAKKAFHAQELANTLRKYLTFVAINIALLVLLVLLVSNETSRRVSDLQDRYQAVINLSESPKVREIETAIADLNDTSLRTKNLVQNLFDWTIIIDHIREVTPEDVTIQNIAVVPTTDRVKDSWDVLINGNAASRSSVLGLTDRLRQSGLLTDIKLPLESLEGTSAVIFNIEAKLQFKKLLP